MHSGGGQAHDRVADPAGAAIDDRVQGDGAERRADQVEAVGRGVAPDDLRQLADLAAGDLDACGLGSGLQADADLAQQVGIGRLDRQVIQQRQGLGPHADQVVDVHGHAIDPDGVKALGLLGHDHL